MDENRKGWASLPIIALVAGAAAQFPGGNAELVRHGDLLYVVAGTVGPIERWHAPVPAYEAPTAVLSVTVATTATSLTSSTSIAGLPT